MAPRSIRQVVYFGTPQMAVAPLVGLIDAGIDVSLVVTNPDVRRGRGNDLLPSPVKAAAQELGLPVAHDPVAAAEVGADLGVVVAYGHLLRPELLAVLPMVNLHFSLLPAWRGAAPVERAFLAGDAKTGVCIIEVADELDAGGIYAQQSVPIGPSETLTGLQERLVAVGTELLVSTLIGGLGDPEPQHGEVTWARKVSPEDFVIDWAASADLVDRVVRTGRAHTVWRQKRFRVHEVAPADSVAPPLEPGELDGCRVGTGTVPLRLGRVQPEGKPVVDADAWANGARLEPGERLGVV